MELIIPQWWAKLEELVHFPNKSKTKHTSIKFTFKYFKEQIFFRSITLTKQRLPYPSRTLWRTDWLATTKHLHSVHRGIKPPSKTPPPSFLPNLPIYLQTVQAPPPPLGNPPPLYQFFVTPPPPLPPLKVGFFSERPKY